MIHVPWAKPGSGFTMLSRAFVLQLAMTMPMAKMAAMLDEHDTRLWRIIERYVQKARKEADYGDVDTVGVDETSHKRGHHYVSLFVDMTKTRVMHVAEGKNNSVFASFRGELKKRQINPTQITSLCMDLSPAFRKGARENFPAADVTFDKFHLIKAMNHALDQVRREEQHDKNELKHSRYLWLHNPSRLSRRQTMVFAQLSKSNLKTARAYRIKLALQDIYHHAKDKDTAEKLLKKWYGWAVRSRLTPVKEFAKTIKYNWVGILNYFETRLTTGIMESINSIVQSARNRAKGYRNVNTFISMIFLLGGKLNFNQVS